MDELVCQACFINYDKYVAVPKILKCGDTICSSCVKSTFKCPKCDGSLTSQNSDDYFVNITILRILESLKDGTTGSAFLQHCIVTLKKKYADIESKFKKNSEKLNSDLEDILLRINELNEEGETSQTILTINKQLDEIRNSSVFGLQSSSISKTINLCNFKDPVTFLCEIYNRAADGELIYATTKVEEVVKFSRISVWSSKLILHAFDYLHNDCPSRTICKFQEIKKCLNDANCYAFLEICSNEWGRRLCLMIQTTNSSLVPQFLKFCTGEKGPVYKGASFQKGVDEEIKSIMKDSPYGINRTEKNDLNAFSQESTTAVSFCSLPSTSEGSQPSTTASSIDTSLLTTENSQLSTAASSIDTSLSTTTSTVGGSLLTTESSLPSNIFSKYDSFSLSKKSINLPATASSFSSAATGNVQPSKIARISLDNKTVAPARLDYRTPFQSECRSRSQLLTSSDTFGKSAYNFTTETTKSVMEVKKFVLNGLAEEGNFEYVSSLGSKSTYKSNDTFVTGSRNGGFQIFQASRDGYALDVIGTIHEPHELLDNITYGDYSKITDSGIAVEIPSRLV